LPAITEPPFDPAREERELREYLGSDFELDRLWHYTAQLEAALAECGDEQAFYRTSTAYLYDLTAFAMTGTKLPYLRELLRWIPPGARVLDYGCGIGSDGLALLEAGYRVEFADFDNPSLEYLRWRLRRRRLTAAVHDLDREVPGGFDATYAYDVIEHVDDPLAFLGELERRARVVEVNLLEPVPGDTALHHDLPIAALLDHVADSRLRTHRRLYDRSHLVVYEPGPVTAARRLLNRARLAGPRFKQRIAARR
jgi:SAM-dependent methyltransferase